MGYLIFRDRESGALLMSKRHALREPAWEHVAKILQDMYPNHMVFNPLRTCPHGRVISVYTSKDKKGVGRSGSSVNLWAVKGALK